MGGPLQSTNVNNLFFIDCDGISVARKGCYLYQQNDMKLRKVPEKYNVQSVDLDKCPDLHNNDDVDDEKDNDDYSVIIGVSNDDGTKYRASQ